MKKANFFMHIACLLPSLCCASAWAMDAAQQQASWIKSAQSQDAAFKPSATRGKALYEHAFNKHADMASCVACHTADPRAQGKHAITGKSIAPLSPLANPERFADAAKTEKWFKRNCNDVAGRECSAAEKSDFVEFLTKGLR